MGFMIQLLFEPSMLGVSHIMCTRCGKVHSMENVQWNTNSDPVSSRDVNGADTEESPHGPVCDCGEDTIIGNAIADYNEIRLKDEIVMFPRNKDIKVWKKVEPYRTKKGKMSTWKLDFDAGAKQMKAYDDLQKRVSMRIPLEELIDMPTFMDLYTVFGDVNITLPFMELCTGDGLIVIRPRSTYHPKCPWHEKKRLGWRKDARTGEWHNLADYDEALNQAGYDMERGRLPRSLVYDEAIGDSDDDNVRTINLLADETTKTINGTLGHPRDWALINDEVYQKNAGHRPEPEEETYEGLNFRITLS